MRTHNILVVCALCVCEMLADDARPRQLARTVYIVSMTNELDQYLASRITSGDVMRVVLEPARADVVLTDKLDEAFWAWMAATYPVPERPSNANLAIRRRSSSNKKDAGIVFLVDPRARLVLWFTYNRGRTTSPDELDHTAESIAKQLKSRLYEK